MSGRLIHENDVLRMIENSRSDNPYWGEKTTQAWEKAHDCILSCVAAAPTVNTIELPCKIGDTVWFAKQYKCHRHPRQGVVSEMYFVKEGDEMFLHVVVKSIGRGKWGERVFGTCEEAQAAIDGWST